MSYQSGQLSPWKDATDDGIAKIDAEILCSATPNLDFI